MTFNINEFKSEGLRFGGAKASLFKVDLTWPAGVGDVGGAGNKSQFLIQTSTLPPSEMGTIEVPYFGRKIKLAGDRTFGEWSVTVMNDEDFLIRDNMENWMARINSHEANLRESGQSPASYKSQATITQYGKDGRTLKIYSFVGLYPSNVAEIAMDWDTIDDIERFDVTFQYDYWVVGGQNGAANNMG